MSVGPLTEIMRDSRSTLMTMGLISAVVNVLMLAGPLYMLQVYDRVLASQSVPTLIVLSVFIFAAFGFQGFLDIIRQRITIRLASVIDERLQGMVHRAVLAVGLGEKKPGDAVQPVRQLDSLRTFMTGAGLSAFFDAPWVPVYLAICFIIHPWLGLLALAGSLVLTVLAIVTERVSRKSVQVAGVQAGLRSATIEGDRKNAETVQAMGMQGFLLSRWERVNTRFLAANEASADVVSTFGAITKTLRMALQSAILGLGAFAVIQGEMSAGAMIAASIMMGRALQPIEVAVGNWRGFVGAREAYQALNERLASFAKQAEVTQLPPPTKSLEVDGVAVLSPGATTPTLQGIRFELQAGEAMGMIGPSGAGKTSLARVLTGIWAPVRGTVRLDGAELNQWSPEDLGRSIGFLAQDVGLFEGTIAENIARMSPQPDSAKVLAAARAAGAHDLILRMPEGYDTPIGEGGSFLSAGQRQRIALARALYGDPFFIVLDEPQSNLDSEGETALLKAMDNAKKRGGIVIVISHRPSTLANVDKILVVNNGGVQDFGTRDDVLRRLAAANAPRVAGKAAQQSVGQNRPNSSVVRSARPNRPWGPARARGVAGLAQAAQPERDAEDEGDW